MHDEQHVTAIIPLKALASAKSRLAGDLDEDARRALVGWMFAQVIEACSAARDVSDVVVVAGDRDAVALARREGARVMAEPAPGLNVALTAATTAIGAATTSLVVAADLPLARGEDLDLVCAAGADADRVVVVVPTRDGGTAVLLRRPAAVVPTAYGPESASAHLALARRSNVAARRVVVPTLALDVDTPAHLREASALGAQHPLA